MTHIVRFVAVFAVLMALVVCAPVQAQTPDIDAQRARAEEGDVVEQFLLGFMYDNGTGVPQDDAEAARWYRLAAEQGSPAARVYLGNMHRSGRGVSQDYAEAVRWYRLAAEQGFANAQANLGVSYSNGQGVPQDYVQAHLWFNLAASRLTGELRERAVNDRDEVANLLTPDDLSEAQRLAREWEAAHPR